MVTQTKPEVERHEITIEDISAAVDQAFQRFDAALARLEPVLESGPDAGGWTPRHLLSHLIGAWQRVPVHAAFFIACPSTCEVPIQLHDDYWIPEWETAPLQAFRLALRAAYAGNKAFLRDLDPAYLARTASTPFGESTLGELLLGSYKGHIDSFHIPQLEAFL